MNDMQSESSAPLFPLTEKSNEATKDQLAFAKAEGDSIDKCIHWLLTQTKSMSGSVHAGEYIITYAVTAPEGWYEYVDNAVQWQPPSANAIAHVWVFVQDAADKRLVPDLDVQADFLNASSSMVESKQLPFAWMPFINGYGNNFSLSKDGNYTLRLNIKPPSFHRHDPYNGDRFTKLTVASIDLSFNKKNIAVEKLSDRMEEAQNLSKATGNAYLNTLQEMYKQATDGKDTIAGDYFIAIADEYSEGYWLYDNKFRYKAENEQSAVTNAHIEVAVLDANTKRFIHSLHVVASIYDTKGKKINSMMEHFMWHPWLYHYGDNWRVPSSGKNYHIHVHIEPPAYRRYGKLYGKQFTQPADADFYNIEIKTGQK